MHIEKINDEKMISVIVHRFYLVPGWLSKHGLYKIIWLFSKIRLCVFQIKQFAITSKTNLT
jgi:hypothetical protein